MVITGKASFNQLAMGLKHSEPLSLTKQAVWKRTDALAVAFMLKALTLALLEQWQKAPCKIPALKCHFGRVLVQDSTQQKSANKSGATSLPFYRGKPILQEKTCAAKK